MRFNATTGNNNAGIWQKIEGVDRVQGEVTISFYAKGTNPSGGNFEIELEQYFGSGGSTYISSIETFSVTSEWQRFILIINVPSISGKTISGGNDYYRFYFRQPEGDTSTAAWTLDITGVQLELGKVATPFEHRSYGEELALCQRYYYRIDSAYNNANYQRFAVVNIESGTEAEGFFTHPVEMRAIPALGFSAASDFHVFTANVIRAISVLYIDQSSPTTAGVAITSTGMTAGNVGLLNADNNKDAFIEFKAEL
jgi:hypothetical protein